MCDGNCRSGGVVGLAAAFVAACGLAGSASAQCSADSVYGAPLTATSGDLPLGVAAGDLNNDGVPDVVTANFFGGSVSVLLGNGDGSLQAGIDLPMLEPGAIETVGVVEAAIADLNGDGWNDIVAGVQSGDLGNPGIAVFLNNGAGAFPDLPEYYAFSTQIRGLEIVEMTGDAHLDVVYANRDDNTLNIVPGNGDGTFGAEFFEEFPGGPVGVAIADFDGDGELDIAAPMVFSNEILIAKGNGAGGLTEFGRFAANGPEGIAMGDINGDGNQDLVIPFLNGDAVQFFLGNGNGTFGALQSISTGAGSLPISIELFDVNGDGFADIHAGLFIANQVQVHLSNGDGTFQAAEVFDCGSRPRKFKHADMNGDGTPDLIVANGSVAGTASVVPNACGGTPPCVADTNGDGVLSPADFSAWVAAFNAMSPACDQNGDTACTPADFSAWVANYNAGC